MTVLYQDQNVTVTSSQIICGGRYIPLSAISSVDVGLPMGRQELVIWRVIGTIGGFVALIGFVRLIVGEGISWLLFGLLLLGGSIYAYRDQKRSAPRRLDIRLHDGQTHSLDHSQVDYLLKVESKIKQAMIAR